MKNTAAIMTPRKVEYYMQIKTQTGGHPYIMDPYVYELMGKNIMMISIIAPVLECTGRRNFLV